MVNTSYERIAPWGSSLRRTQDFSISETYFGTHSGDNRIGASWVGAEGYAIGLLATESGV